MLNDNPAKVKTGTLIFLNVLNLGLQNKQESTKTNR